MIHDSASAKTKRINHRLVGFQIEGQMFTKASHLKIETALVRPKAVRWESETISEIVTTVNHKKAFFSTKEERDVGSGIYYPTFPKNGVV